MPKWSASLPSSGSLLAMLAVVGALAMAASPAEAKPKKIVSNGCTVEQIQAPNAGQCIDKMEDDIMHNRPTYHALYCSSTGATLCCEYDQAGNTVDHSCEVLRMSRPPLDVVAPNTGTLAPQSSPEPSGGDTRPMAPAGQVVTLF